MDDAGWMRSLHNPVVNAKTVEINYDRHEYEYSNIILNHHH